ncbi:hypothetical protein UY3_08413 [Chelonia mydas]|uniref:Uncharacterized protein n=1 Tax=Chelonia mydas TaxID=8469 RepID=M7C203_CHEMY|nr:hypothetical protein UY3_08413 [Chelonia mydas]
MGAAASGAGRGMCWLLLPAAPLAWNGEPQPVRAVIGQTCRCCRLHKGSKGVNMTLKLSNIKQFKTRTVVWSTPGIGNLWHAACQRKPPGGPGQFIYLLRPQVRPIAAPSQLLTGRAS